MGRLRALVVATVVAAGTIVGVAAPTAAPAGAAVNPTPTIAPFDRASVWAAYQTSLVEPMNVPVGWTGNTSTCTEGTESAASVQATQAAVNFYRGLVGLPNLTVDSAGNVDAMRAALLQAANADKPLDHFPPSTWSCWTQARRTASENHNLVTLPGARGVQVYMVDPADSNDFAGHRNWVLHPRGTAMSTGSTSTHNALDVKTGGTVPAGVDWISWPNEGFVPKAIIQPFVWWTKTLFSIKNVAQSYDYSAASVTVKVGSTSLPVEIRDKDYGQLTWYTTLPNDWASTGDVKMDVTVSGIKTSGGTTVAPHTYSSTAIVSGTTATAPGAPTGVTAVRGNGQATVSWSAPTSNGGSPITQYLVTAYAGGTSHSTKAFDATATSRAFTGLTNGTAYTFRVVAVNEAGTGAQSTASPAVTPATTPSPPTGVTATAGSGQATVSWTAPANGGSPITGYRVTPSIGAAAQTVRTFDASTTTRTITGLTNGSAHTFRVEAVNAVGASAPSAASAAVTPIASATVPGVPTGVTATAGNAQATVSWTAPGNGGSAITGYKVTPSIGGTAQPAQTFTGTGTTRVVTGLTNGTAYTFRVQAVNAVGTGALSAATASVTPSGPKFAPYASWTELVDQLHRQLLGRRATTTEKSQWVGPLQAGTSTPGDLAAALRQTAHHRTVVDQVTRLYRAYYLRIPDKGGLEYWIGKRLEGRSLASISAFFAKSSEFVELYGDLTHQGFVETIYQNILGRPGESDGVAYWTGQITSGKRTRGAVMIGFSEAQEYRNAQASETTVSVLYVLWLDRSPTAIEFADGVAALDGGQSVADYADTLLPKASVLP